MMCERLLEKREYAYPIFMGDFRFCGGFPAFRQRRRLKIHNLPAEPQKLRDGSLPRVMDDFYRASETIRLAKIAESSH